MMKFSAFTCRLGLDILQETIRSNIFRVYCLRGLNFCLIFGQKKFYWFVARIYTFVRLMIPLLWYNIPFSSLKIYHVCMLWGTLLGYLSALSYFRVVGFILQYELIVHRFDMSSHLLIGRVTSWFYRNRKILFFDSWNYFIIVRNSERELHQSHWHFLSAALS